MALSGTRDQADTVADIITDAMTKLGLIVAGETVSTQDQAACLRALKHMLRTWATKGVRLWLKQDQTVTPVAGTASYTLAIRALEVLQAYRRTNGSDTPIRLYTREEYNRLPDKTASGSPFVLWPDRDLTATTVTLYPVPDAASAAADSIRVTCKVQIQDVTAGSQDIEVPAEWTEALVYNLAVRIAPDFQVMPRADVVEMAAMLYRDLEGHDREQSVTFRPSRYS